MDTFSHGLNFSNSDFSRFLRGLVLTWDYLWEGLSGEFFGIHTKQTIQDVNMWVYILVKLICRNFKTLRRDLKMYFAWIYFHEKQKPKYFAWINFGEKSTNSRNFIHAKICPLKQRNT